MIECYFALGNNYPDFSLDMEKNAVWCMLCSLKFSCKLTPLQKNLVRKTQNEH